ncbi:MAG: hypothetical protein B6D59_03690 [Campylobacteraceae bacterium 4484_4]|nr:MAG: hypothetical protein B6D59_03690 [Campylobacteraceae bacterium 4484_4]
MKKLFTALMLGSALASSSFAANADDYIDYVSIGLGIQDIDNSNFDTGAALVVNAGKSVFYDVGVEVEGCMSVSKAEGEYNGVKDDLDFWSLGIYGTYVWKLDRISIKPRVGLVYVSEKSDLNIHSGDPLAKTDKKKIEMSAGIGVAYKMGENYSLFTNYTRYEDEINQINFGAEFKF